MSNALNYRGYKIECKKDGYVYIYDKSDNYIKRIEGKWKSSVSEAKYKIDEIIKLYGK